MNADALLATYAASFGTHFPMAAGLAPWEAAAQVLGMVQQQLQRLDNEYVIRNGVAIHKRARVEKHVVLKAPVIVSAGCFIAAHAYLRGGVFLGEGVIIGPGCEIKSSLLMPRTAFAHFNFVGDSIVGSDVNMEAGAVIANHHNERRDKAISVRIDDAVIATGANKFGALVGDGCKIGANAVLSPGTLLSPGTVVRRLELVEQVKYIG